ncbi:MAG: YaiI/YqxD family protein [Magnetococcales bacterium]|nr:YaiI/YqxD family protein [Magnetococcales bacterium]
MPEIYVDGDACPVKEEVLRVATRHGLVVHMVSHQWMRLGNTPPRVRVVRVSKGTDSADDWIVEHIQAGDIAVTADILLANRCLEVGARAIHPNGKPFDVESIGMAVAMRELMANLRDIGQMVGQTGAFTKQDRSRFLGTLENAVQASLREKQSRPPTQSAPVGPADAV